MFTSIGIDLGTTFSAAAYLDESGQCKLIPDRYGALWTPSTVWFPAHRPIVVGSEAVQAMYHSPFDVVHTAKQHMGDPDWIWEFEGHFYRPQDISSLILKKLKLDAEHHLRDKVTHIVLTVPAHFTERQRHAALESAHLSDLTVHQLLNEPTAALLAFPYSEIPDNGRILLFDLGGGTLDLTCVESKSGFLHVKGSLGRRDIGGDRWTDVLVHYAATRYISQYGVDPLDDPYAYYALYDACRQSKHELSTNESSTILLKIENEETWTLPISRQLFESLGRPLLEQVKTTYTQLLRELQWEQTAFDRICIVGGASQMPMFSSWIESLTHQSPLHLEQPEQAVVQGAALQAAFYAEKEGVTKRDTNSKDLFLPGRYITKDVSSHTLGLIVLDSEGNTLVDPIIPKNTPLPCSKSLMYLTAYDHQTSIELRFVEGESRVSHECIPVASAEWTELSPRLKGQPIELTVSYDASGLFSISIVDIQKNTTHQVQVHRTTERARYELDRMRRILQMPLKM